MVIVFYLSHGFVFSVAGVLVYWLVVKPLRWGGHQVCSVGRAAVRLIGSVPGLTAAERRTLAARVAPWGAGLALATAAVWATGGVLSLSFWGTVAIRLAMAGFQTLLVGPLLALLVTGLVEAGRWLLRTTGLPKTRLGERRADALGGTVVAVVGVVIYAGLADYPLAGGARLPLADPVWGSLLVLAAMVAGGAAAGVPIRRYRDRHFPGRRSSFPPAITAEPEEEFWSPTPVSGWRAWSWNGHVLHGVMTAWPTESLTATCQTCPQVPGWNHLCGIYAVTDRKNVAAFPVGSAVVGRVELSGLVIEHERGYRGEEARIVELHVDSADTADALAARYPGVPVSVKERNED
jgi:hypothetical protein